MHHEHGIEIYKVKLLEIILSFSSILFLISRHRKINRKTTVLSNFDVSTLILLLTINM